ncbi:lamin tail domain-containing protein [Actinopolymorpha singaporensis]|uniref:Lamin Tail Domain n=1 Tax=Actinopolymorpha singaporensis TaxID=117157 RepID=A0A1H1R0Y0_9ACTN|nr:lamin tail domain-containing protein [Actinopolymorpha singaporensis]SDS29408.1 Lamin Tail Domain [Actinopolymorpha singaporensis]
MSPRRTALGAVAAATAIATAALVGIGAAFADDAVSAGPNAAAVVPTAQDLFISEIHPDDPGDDNHEFFEVTNTTGAAINLAAEGLQISYGAGTTPATAAKFALTDGVAGNAVAAGPLNATIPAHGSAVFWIEYTSSASLNTYVLDEANFRSYYGDVPATAPIYKVEGQNGMANTGDRILALVTPTGQIVSSSYYGARSSTTPGVSAHLVVPAAGSTAAAHLMEAEGSPGKVTPEQLGLTPSPTPTPTPTPVPEYPTPVISGSPSVGKTLTVDPGTWSPADPGLDIQWYADEKPLPGATGPSLKIDGKLRGTLITVTVTGHYQGDFYTETSYPTAPVGAVKGNH